MPACLPADARRHCQLDLQDVAACSCTTADAQVQEQHRSLQQNALPLWLSAAATADPDTLLQSMQPACLSATVAHSGIILDLAVGLRKAS